MEEIPRFGGDFWVIEYRLNDRYSILYGLSLENEAKVMNLRSVSEVGG